MKRVIRPENGVGVELWERHKGGALEAVVLDVVGEDVLHRLAQEGEVSYPNTRNP